MKTTNFNRYIFLAAFLITTALSIQADVFDSTKKKEFNQSFSISASDELNIDNRYGSVTISHWDRNEVAIRVEVTAKASSDSKAQEGLDRVQVELKKTGSTVYGITTLKSQSVSSNTSLTIDYHINMPSKLAFTVAQKYGSINLPQLNEGKAVLEVKYGSIKAGSFTNTLTLNAGYSDVSLGDMKTAAMQLSYCGNVNAGNGENISAEAGYSNLKFLNVEKIKVENKYGNLKVQEARQVHVEIKYGNVDIERLRDELIAGTLDYSNVTIKNLDAGFKKIDASARYGNVTLSVPSKAAFRVAASGMKYSHTTISGLNITGSNVEKENGDYTINGGGSGAINFKSNGYSNLKINAL